MTFDIRTLSFMTMICSFLCTIISGLLFFTRKTYNGSFLWFLANLLGTFGFLLLALRNIIPDFFTINIANSLLMLLSLFMYLSSLKFDNIKKYKYVSIGITFFSIILFQLSVFFDWGFKARIIIISLQESIIFLFIFFLIFIKTNKNKRLSQKYFYLVFLIISVTFLVRAFIYYFDDKTNDLMAQSFTNAFIFIIVSILLLIATFFYILMTSQKLRDEINLEKESILIHQKNLEILNEKIDSQTQKIKYYAIHDTMSGTFNRTGGLNHLSDFLSESYGKKIFFIYLDIDNLKPVNDKFGHDRGDELIKTVVALTKNYLNNNDFIIRLGGDEFLCVLSEIDLSNIEKKLNNLNNSLFEFSRKNSYSPEVSVSYGITDFTMSENADISELISSADHKMYKNKNARKNTGGSL